MSLSEPSTPASRSSGGPAPAPAKKRGGVLTGILRVAFGAIVLALVARTLPWSDKLLFRTGAGDEALSTAIDGKIEGDWTADAIAFRAEPGTTPDPAWPAAVRELLAAGELVRVERGAADPAQGGSFDWRPSMQSAFREMRPGGLAQALLLFTAAMGCAVTRWWRILRVVGCATSWLNAWRLTLLGMFFNLVVPGLTGGDVVKGVIVAHENPGRRGEAVLSIGLDRLAGMIALATLALVVILLSGDAFAELRLPVALFLGAGIAGVAAYASRGLRRLVRFDALLARLPLGAKLRQLDQAVLSFGNRRGELVLALALSFGNHALLTLGFVALGQAFAVEGLSLLDWYVIVPVASMISALPLAPGGWGVGEAAFKVLFEMIGADGGLGVAISVTFRLSQLAYGLLGGLFLLLPGQRRELKASEAAAGAQPLPSG